MEKAMGRPYVTCQAPKKIGTPEVRFLREGQHPVDNVLVYFVYDGEEISPEVQAKSCANVMIDENGAVVVSANQTSAFYEEFISKASHDSNPSSHNLLFSVDFNVEQNLLTIDGTFPPQYQKDVQSLPSPLSAVTIPETERERSERKRQAKIEIEHLLQAFQHGNHELRKSVDELHQQGLVRVQEGELKAGKRWSKDDLMMMEIPSRIKNLPPEITDQPDRLRSSDSPPTLPKATNTSQVQDDWNFAPLHRSEPFGFEPSQLRNTLNTPSSSSLSSTHPALGSAEDPGSGIFSWIFSSFSNKPQLVSTNDHPNGNDSMVPLSVSESATTSSCSSDPMQVKALKRGRGRSMSARVSRKATDAPKMREGGNESGEASPRVEALQEDELGRVFEEKLKELSLNDPVEEFWKKESQTASSFLVPYRTRSPIDQIESVIALSRSPSPSPSPVTVSDISNLMNEPLSSPYATPMMGSPAPCSPHVKRVAPGIFSPPASGPPSRPSSRTSSRATSPDRRVLETSTL